MKLLLFLLLPVLSFAQSFKYPDSLTTSSGKSFSCYVKSIDESSVDIIYSQNVPIKGNLQGIRDISLEKLGAVYQNDKGFLLPLDTLRAFLSKREKEHPFEVNLNKPQMALPPKANVAPAGQFTESSNLQDPIISPAVPSEELNRWSFGISYIPYYSGKIYSIYEYQSPNYQVEIYPSVNNFSVTEGEFSCLVVPKLRLILNLRYTSVSSDDRSESHTRDQVYNNNYDGGTSTGSKLNLFNFDLGIKYYLASLFNQRTRAYVLAGIGKQFASVSYKSENLFQPTTPVPVQESNREEFLRDLNSPFHLFAGFGAEYSFNDYLSLFSNIRFYYSSISASYDSRFVSGTLSQTRTREYKTSEVNTYVAVGLNFYF